MISIHAPRERSDKKAEKKIFLPEQISIHAPRERSDLSANDSIFNVSDFNPRSS